MFVQTSKLELLIISECVQAFLYLISAFWSLHHGVSQMHWRSKFTLPYVWCRGAERTFKDIGLHRAASIQVLIEGCLLSAIQSRS